MKNQDISLVELEPTVCSRGQHYHLENYVRTGLTPFVRTVCNIDSLARVVLEESKRKSNEIFTNKGEMMTVIFTDTGGTFYTDDILEVEQNLWHFKRRFTTLWSAISKQNGRKLDHRGLLDFLESIKNYVVGFEDLYQALSKLRISKKVSFTSNPVYTGEDISGAYEFAYSIGTGNTVVAVCPAQINFKGRIVRGANTEYEFSMNLSPEPDEETGKIFFALNMPGIDLVIDQVCEDDLNTFAEQVKSLPELLVLRDW
jgi:uncharacterized protein YfdQ (DUF2303 family)